MTPSARQSRLGGVLRLLFLLLEKLLTRTTITGLENLPRESDTPFIFAANHASTYDPLLLMFHIPFPIRPVGPGDFKLLFPANYVVKWLGVILIQRGAADRDSLKKMTEVLKNGENLSLFPEGGTWEKRLDDVKPGVAYLSLTTGARIVPISIGGSYRVWWQILLLRRPQITLHFEPPLPPVVSTDRKQRAADLRNASLNLMQIIYAHLPYDEQARYDLHSRQQFSGKVEVLPAEHQIDTDFDFHVLAELISKPNLFSPLHENLKLPLKPFLRSQRFHPAQDFLIATTALLETFTGDFKEYLSYRLGDKKAAHALLELEALQRMCQQAREKSLAVRFRPQVVVVSDPLPPNE